MTNDFAIAKHPAKSEQKSSKTVSKNPAGASILIFGLAERRWFEILFEYSFDAKEYQSEK